MPRSDDLAARFWAKVSPEPNTGCWMWTGGLTKAGYGAIGAGGGTANGIILAHRLAFEMKHGRPPAPGLDVCHRCDNRWCVNADRCLFEGSRLVNVRDAVAKGRHAPPPHFRGEAHPHAVVNEATVRSIRRLREKGISCREIAERHGLKKATVDAIASGRNWGHVS